MRKIVDECSPFAQRGILEEVDKYLDEIQPQKYIEEDDLGIVLQFDSDKYSPTTRLGQAYIESFGKNILRTTGFSTKDNKYIISYRYALEGELKQKYIYAPYEVKEKLWEYITKLNRVYWLNNCIYEEKLKEYRKPIELNDVLKSLMYYYSTESKSLVTKKMLLLNIDFEAIKHYFHKIQLNMGNEYMTDNYTGLILGTCVMSKISRSNILIPISMPNAPQISDNLIDKLVLDDKERFIQWLRENETDFLFYCCNAWHSDNYMYFIYKLTENILSGRNVCSFDYCTATGGVFSILVNMR